MSFFGDKNIGLDALLNRPRPSTWQRFCRNPCAFLASKLYTCRRVIPREPLTDAVSVVCISDTHNLQRHLPDGDILIHAGDLTQSGTLQELQAALAWLRSQPHGIKVVVAGNHDLLLDATQDGEGRTCTEREMLDWGNIIYLENSETEVTCANGRRLRIYGSPYSPKHGNWAFQYPRDKNVWEVPDDVDILVTHGPPRAHLDLLSLGCVHLLGELWRVRPRAHVFGHVHEGAGTEWVYFDGLQEMYEQTVVHGGLWNLAWMVFGFVGGLFRRGREARCLLVNASVVGGLRDEKRRGVISITV